LDDVIQRNDEALAMRSLPACLERIRAMCMARKRLPRQAAPGALMPVCSASGACGAARRSQDHRRRTLPTIRW